MRYLFILSIFLGLSACAQKSPESQDNVKPSEAAAMIDDDAEIVILDVRTPAEYKAGHLAGAENIDYYADNFKSRLAELDSAKRYLVYCRSGSRSDRAARILRGMGFSSVSNIEGGIIAWEQAKLPVKK